MEVRMWGLDGPPPTQELWPSPLEIMRQERDIALAAAKILVDLVPHMVDDNVVLGAALTQARREVLQ